MDRNELIVRLAVADWGNPRNAAPVPHVWIGEIARYADAVMSVLTPAPCPPPVAGSGATLPDNVREFLLDVEYAAKWANQPQGPAIEYVKGRLKELAARAHDILTSPVRP